MGPGSTFLPPERRRTTTTNSIAASTTPFPNNSGYTARGSYEHGFSSPLNGTTDGFKTVAATLSNPFPSGVAGSDLPGRGRKSSGLLQQGCGEVHLDARCFPAVGDQLKL